MILKKEANISEADAECNGSLPDVKPDTTPIATYYKWYVCRHVTVLFTGYFTELSCICS